VKVALVVGVIVSSPIWLYQIWAFVAPGLHAREKRWSYIFLGAAIPLFGIGAASPDPFEIVLVKGDESVRIEGDVGLVAAGAVAHHPVA
jgi:hypothetical protein